MENMYDILNKFNSVAGSKKQLNEGVQQVQELKKSTLASYAKKASADAVQKTQDADAEAEYGDPRKSDPLEKKAEKRLKGVGKAVDRLVKEDDMDESALQAYLGKKKYGETGMKALQKAGRDGASKETMAKIRAKHDKMDEADMGEGNKFAHNVLKAKAAGLKKADLDGDGDMETVREEPMTPKQKKFAALAAPKDKITFADKIAGAKKEVDEMLGDVAAKAMREAVKGNAMESDDDYEEKPRKTAAGGTVSYHAGGVTRHKAAPGRYGGYNPETDPDKDEYDDKATGEKRGRGRPKGTGKRIGAKGPSGKSKLMSKESAMHESDEIAQAKALLKKAGYTVSKDDKEDLDEKAVSKKQQKFMGMVHAAQKGEKPASKEVAKVAKSMKKSDAEDFAATKHKGLPEKKKKEVEETTTAGSVAPAPSTGKAGSMFGKGVYEAKIAESFNKKLDSVLNEGMSVNMSVDADGKKSLSVTATDEDAVALSKLLNLAGIDAGAASMEPEAPVMVGAMEEDLANSPEPHYSDIETMINTLSGGLDGKKSTGQTTAPVVNRDPSRGSIGPVSENKESRLWELYHRYSSK